MKPQEIFAETGKHGGNESDVKSDRIALLAAGQREPGKGAELGNLCRFWSSCCKKGQQGPWTLQLQALF